MYEQYLQHHGILGQKWGVRRYQNKDGSLTAEGKNRYSDLEKKVASAQKKKNSTIRTTYETSEHFQKRKETADRNLYLAKRELAYAKAKDAYQASRTDKKSKRQLKLEEDFKKQGMSDEESAVYAYKQKQIEKYVAIAGAAALTATAAYVAYKHYDKAVDKYIGGDKLMYRIEPNDSKGLTDFFYTVTDKKDANKYVGLFAGGHLGGVDNADSNIYQKVVKGSTNLKIASDKNATKIANKLFVDNGEFRQALVKANLFTESEIKKIGEGLTSGNNRKTKTDVNIFQRGTFYEKFNSAIAGLNHQSRDTSNSVVAENSKKVLELFRSAMEAEGYDGVRDINDRKFSGYNAKTPTIIFDKSKAVVDSVSKLTQDRIKEQYNIENAKIRKRAERNIALATSAPTMAMVATVIASNGVNTVVYNKQHAKKNQEIVSQYLAEHPNSKLSYNQILKNYKG